jgi:hypothetical protein
MGLIQKPGPNLLTLDGVNDRVEIEGSDVPGNPYDVEHNETFVMGARFITTSSNTNQYFFQKIGGSVGYWAQLVWFESKLGPYFAVNQPANRSILWTSNVATGVPYAFVAGWQVGGHFLSVYNRNGGVIGSVAGAGSYTATTIKNTGKLIIGGGNYIFKGQISNPCFFKGVVFSDAQKHELGLMLIQDEIRKHSLYATYCTGHWLHFGGANGKVPNLKNPNYPGIMVNF